MRMENRTYSFHTSDENIRRIDQHAERIRRSRSSLINEAIEMFLEHLDADNIKQIETRNRKKAGAR